MKDIKQIREEQQKIDSQIVEDHEFSMARSELKSIISNAQNLLGKLKGEGDLEAWMQSKITKAADYLTAVHDNIASGEADIKEDHEEKEIKLDTKDKKIPFTIMLRRRSIRQFPNNQTVALYYAPSLDRYFSIPFGEKSGNVIAEAKKKDIEAFPGGMKSGMIRSIKAGKVPAEHVDAIRKQYNISDEELGITKPAPSVSGKVTGSFAPQKSYGKVTVTPTVSKPTPAPAAPATPASTANQPYKGRKLTDQEYRKKIRSITKKITAKTADVKPEEKPDEKKKDAGFLGVGDEFMGHSTFGVTKLGAALGGAAGLAARGGGKAAEVLSRPLRRVIKSKVTSPIAKSSVGQSTGKAVGAVKSFFRPIEKSTVKENLYNKINEKRQIKEESILDTIKKTVDPSSPTFLAPVTSSVSGDIPKNVEQKKETLKKLRQKTVDDRKEIQRKAEAGDVEGAEKYAKENPAVIVPKEVKQSVEKATPEDVTKRMAGAEHVAAAVLAAHPVGRFLGRSALGAAGAGVRLAGKAIKGLAGLAGGDSEDHPLYQQQPQYKFSLKPKVSKAIKAPTKIQENVIDQLKELATKTDLTNNMLIVNEEQIDINSNIAEKVIQVYEALNDDNKAKFAKMLGESKQSFQKAVNFALRYKNG